MTKIAIIGTQQSGRTILASKLGKKGNVSDITMYDFEKSTTILTTVDATGYPKSIKPLITALNLTDAVLLCIPPTGLDTYTGECIVALDLLGCKHGIIVITKSDTTYHSALDELKQTIKKDNYIYSPKRLGYDCHIDHNFRRDGRIERDDKFNR